MGTESENWTLTFESKYRFVENDTVAENIADIANYKEAMESGA